MTQSKHTPAPWFSDGVWVNTVNPDNGVEYGILSTGHFYMDDEEMKANANLIAAAPELLDALELCAGLVMSDRNNDCPAYIQAQKAIKKARGE